VFDLADLPRPVIRYVVGLWRRRWVVVLGAWAAALALWFLIWLLPDEYESRAQVFVQTETILQPVVKDVAAAPDYKARVDVMRQQLLTRPNVEEVVFRSGLDKTIEASSEIDRRVKLEGLVRWVSESIKIESPQPRYFIITYRNGDRELARRVVDAFLNLLIEQDLGASLEDKEEARRLLEGQITQFNKRLKDEENAIAEFRRVHAEELAVVEGANRHVDEVKIELQRTSDQIASEERQVATLRSLLSQTSRSGSGELDALRVQLAQLRSQYNENYPDIQNLQARIREMERGGGLPANPEFRRLQVELATAESRIVSLKERETKLRADQAELTVARGQAPAVQIELERLERAKTRTETQYNELLKNRDELTLTTNLGAGGQGVEYKVFERPTAALRPSDPPRFILILAAFVLALGAGAALALLLTFLDKTFSQTETLEQKFGLPVLGSLSTVSSAYTRELRKKDLRRLGGALAGLAAVMLVYLYVSVLRLPGPAEAGGPQTASAAADREPG
jgi:polysaccharide chain length determinant protein (PEP-CTERM system associated)